MSKCDGFTRNIGSVSYSYSFMFWTCSYHNVGVYNFKYWFLEIFFRSTKKGVDQSWDSSLNTKTGIFLWNTRWHHGRLPPPSLYYSKVLFVAQHLQGHSKVRTDKQTVPKVYTYKLEELTQLEVRWSAVHGAAHWNEPIRNVVGRLDTSCRAQLSWNSMTKCSLLRVFCSKSLDPVCYL